MGVWDPFAAADIRAFYDSTVAANSGVPIRLHVLRLDEEDAERAARLGATAVVTAIVGEGTADERVARLDVSFAGAGASRGDVKVDFDGSALRVEGP